MASTLSAAELPQHERGASVVPTVATLGTSLARLADRALRIVVALAARTDLDATALIGVAGGVQRVRDGLDQICAACAPPRELEGVDGAGAQLDRVLADKVIDPKERAQLRAEFRALASEALAGADDLGESE